MLRTPVQVHKVAVLPAKPQPNALYFVRTGDIMEIYMVSSTGTPVLAWNGPRIKAQIDAALAALQVPVTWSLIADGPVSTVAAIDAAVRASHTHTNRTVLDALSDADGDLTYKGSRIGATATGFDGGTF